MPTRALTPQILNTLAKPGDRLLIASVLNLTGFAPPSQTKRRAVSRHSQWVRAAESRRLVKSAT